MNYCYFLFCGLLFFCSCQPSIPTDLVGSQWTLVACKSIDEVGDTSNLVSVTRGLGLLMWESDSLSLRTYALNWDDGVWVECRAYQWLDEERLRWGMDTLVVGLEGEELVLTEYYGATHTHAYYRRLPSKRQGMKAAAVQSALSDEVYILKEQLDGKWQDGHTILHYLPSGWVVPERTNIPAFEREQWTWWSKGDELHLVRQKGKATWQAYQVVAVRTDGLDLQHWTTGDSLCIQKDKMADIQYLTGHWKLPTHEAEQAFLSKKYSFLQPPPLPELPSERRWSLEWKDDLLLFRQGEKLDTLPYQKSSSGVLYSIPYFFYKGTPTRFPFYFQINQLEEDWLSIQRVCPSHSPCRGDITYYQLDTTAVE